MAFQAQAHPGRLGNAFSLMHVNTDQVQITALKKAEDNDDIIVRLQEVGGAPVAGVRADGCRAHRGGAVKWTARRTRSDQPGSLPACSVSIETYGAHVNNAGVMPVSPLDALRVEDSELMVDVNIKGVLYGIAAALPVFRQQGFGHVINTASTAAFRVVPNQSVYAGTKMAVRA